MNDSFFYLSKILWLIASPDRLFVILLCLCLFLFLIGKQRIARTLLILLTGGIVFISIFSVGDWMLYPLESRFQTNPQLPEKVDGIIILGGSVIPNISHTWQQLETNHTHERISHAIKLALKYPEARVLFTGGNASIDRSKLTEAEFIKTHLIDSGITSERIIVEAEAKNTADNASYSHRLIQPGPDENWILVTTAYHMPRALGVFCQQHWKVIPFPVDHRTVAKFDLDPSFNLIDHGKNLVNATHEWIGLMAYYLTGKTPELIPGSCA